ncbi:MAG: GGDEF domain-containing protein [Candidatus Schekmanbacteria bacterium]|nr:GGDEF domain-containing protein [Candidatus Schekmanbacteria bacterium]
MIKSSLRAFVQTFGCAAAVLLAAWTSLSYLRGAAHWSAAGYAAQIVAMTAAAALGTAFGRFRVALAAALVALADAIFVRDILEIGASTDAYTVLLGASLLLPLSLAVLAVVGERSARSASGMLRLAAVALFPGVAWAQRERYLVWDFGNAAGLLGDSAAVLPFGTLTPAALIAFAAAIAAALIVAVRRRSAVAGGFSGALIAVLAALAELPGNRAAAAAWFAAAVLSLGVSVLQESYGMAYLDELTRLPGRRALNETIARLGRRYAIAMLDVDHFKKFNDTYGHDVGDQLLRFLAVRLRTVGGGGRAFRYGGEEFTVLFFGKTADEARAPLESLRQHVESSRMTVRSASRPRHRPGGSAPRRGGGDRQVAVTISIGVADRRPERRRAAQVMEAADKALYKAKKEGRNRVVSAGSGSR